MTWSVLRWPSSAFSPLSFRCRRFLPRCRRHRQHPHQAQGLPLGYLLRPLQVDLQRLLRPPFRLSYLTRLVTPLPQPPLGRRPMPSSSPSQSPLAPLLRLPRSPYPYQCPLRLPSFTRRPPNMGFTLIARPQMPPQLPLPAKVPTPLHSRLTSPVTLRRS